MILLVIISLLVGAVLGARFKILVLLPAIIFVVCSVLSFGIGQNQDTWSTLLATVLSIAAVEIGYLGGAFTGLFARGDIYRSLPGPTVRGATR